MLSSRRFNGSINDLKLVINNNANAQAALNLVEPYFRSDIGGLDGDGIRAV